MKIGKYIIFAHEKERGTVIVAEHSATSYTHGIVGVNRPFKFVRHATRVIKSLEKWGDYTDFRIFNLETMEFVTDKEEKE